LIAGIVFDLDGVLIESEVAWSRAREAVTTESGGRWHDRAQAEMMGMSSTEWSRYMHERLGVSLPPERISEHVVERLERLFSENLPLVSGAREVVEELGRRWPLAIASSSNRRLIDLTLELSGLAGTFRASVSSEEVRRGKPAPDVYLAAVQRLGLKPADCVAVEDSAGGLRSASVAGMRVIAIPNRDFPPDEESLALTHTVLWSLRQLAPAVVDGLDAASPSGSRAPRRAAVRTAEQGGALLALGAAEGVSFGPLPGPGDSDGGQSG
jgi:HAD superfamily hydrolase (TIGR01509 family)